MPGRDRLRMYLDGVEVALTQIAALTSSGRTVPSTAAARATVGDPTEAGLPELARGLRNQGDLWRGVLTGGLHPGDLLDEENWAVVARIRDRKLVVQAARGIFWPVLVPLLVVLLAVVGVSAAAAAGSPTTRAAVALVGLGAGLTAIWRSVSGPALSVAAGGQPAAAGQRTDRADGDPGQPPAGRRPGRGPGRSPAPTGPDRNESKSVARLTGVDLR